MSLYYIPPLQISSINRRTGFLKCEERRRTCEASSDEEVDANEQLLRSVVVAVGRSVFIVVDVESFEIISSLVDH